MKNPLKFFQEVKQEAFKVTWPTGKETVQGTIISSNLSDILAFSASSLIKPATLFSKLE